MKKKDLNEIAKIEKAIKEKYNLKEEDFSREKKKKIKEIVKKAKDNPDEINEKIENLFGFTAAD